MNKTTKQIKTQTQTKVWWLPVGKGEHGIGKGKEGDERRFDFRC